MIGRHQTIFRVSVVVVITVILSSLVSSPVRRFFLPVFSRPLNFFHQLSSEIHLLGRTHRLANENKLLKQKLSAVNLQRIQVQELQKENQRLKDLLSLQHGIKRGYTRMISANVIGRDPAQWNHALLIDRGTEEGVKVGNAVVASSGVVGRIIESGAHLSKVLLLTDPNSKMTAYLQSSRYEGVVMGVGTDQCRMKYLPLDAAIGVGEVVLTAGFGKIFPKGLVIGTVSEVWKETGQMYQAASIRPSADLQRLEEVLCLEVSSF